MNSKANIFLFMQAHLIFGLGIDCCIETVEKRKQKYISRLFYWNEHLSDYKGEWADFMLKQKIITKMVSAEVSVSIVKEKIERNINFGGKYNGKIFCSFKRKTEYYT